MITTAFKVIGQMTKDSIFSRGILRIPDVVNTPGIFEHVIDVFEKTFDMVI